MRLPNVKKLSVFFLLIGVLLTTLTAVTAQTSPFTLQQTIYPPQPVSDESFGAGVAVEGNTAVFHSAKGAFVYVKQGDSWTFQAVLQPFTPSPEAFHYQYDAAISGDTILLGAHSDDTVGSEAGAAYVFKRSGTSWVQQAKLTASDSASFKRFGFSVALQGDVALIGAPHMNEGQGVAYLFTRNGDVWTQTQKLESASVSFDGRFGWSVALDQNTALIGAAGDTVAGEEYAGSAFIFVQTANGWVEQARLLQTEAEAYDSFGADVDIEGDTAVVTNSIEGGGAPAVYTFTRAGDVWTLQQRLLPASGGQALSVSLEGELLAVGSPFGGIPYSNDEAVTIYLNTNGVWTEQQVITPPVVSNEFGWDVALDNGTLVVGGINYFNNTPETSSAVFIYTNMTVSPPTNLLVNGDFEIDADRNLVPDGWVRRNAPEDALRCNKPDRDPIAYSGNCAFLFKGGTAADRKLAQNIDLTTLNTGDMLKLNGFYNKQSAGNVVVFIYVSYSDQPNDQARIKVTAPTNGYQALPTVGVTLKGKPTRVRIEIQNRTTLGKTFFDGLSFVKHGDAASLIPLP